MLRHAATFSRCHLREEDDDFLNEQPVFIYPPEPLALERTTRCGYRRGNAFN